MLQRAARTASTAVLTLLALIVFASIGSAQAPVTVHVGWPWGPDAQQTQGFLDVVEAFNRENPDIRVEYTLAYGPDKFVVALAGGAAPDVYSIGDGGIKEYILKGYAADISDLVERDASLSVDDFIPPAWARVVSDGSVWGIPYSADPNFAFFTNRTHFNEAGMVASDIRTIADVDAASLRLTQRAPDGTLERAGILPVDVIGGYVNDIFTWGWLFGGTFYDADSEQITPDHDGIVEALEWMIMHDDRIPLAEINSALGGGFWNRFTDGKVSMWPANPPQLGNIRKAAPDLEFDVTPMPTHPNGPDNPMWIGGHTLFVTSSSQVREAAYRFIRYAAASPEGSRMLLEPSGFFPAYRRSDVVEVYRADEKSALFIQLMQSASLQRATIPAIGEYGAELSAAVEAALARSQAPRAALEDVRRRVQPRVDELLSTRK